MWQWALIRDLFITAKHTALCYMCVHVCVWSRADDRVGHINVAEDSWYSRWLQQPSDVHVKQRPDSCSYWFVGSITAFSSVLFCNDFRCSFTCQFQRVMPLMSTEMPIDHIWFFYFVNACILSNSQVINLQRFICWTIVEQHLPWRFVSFFVTSWTVAFFVKGKE